MDLSDDLVTMTDIARLAEVKLPAVSNWRRRHEDFPRSERRNGHDLFVAAEVADWLGGRKMATNDLQDGELAGMTYGDRFRKNKRIAPGPVNTIAEALGRALDEYRGAMDVAVYADLVLGLLHLCVQDRAGWQELAVAGPREIGHPLARVTSARQATRRGLRRAVSAILADSEGLTRLVGITRSIDRARRSSEPRPDWAAHVFEYLLARYAAREGKRGAEFFTPPSVVRLVVESVAPAPGESVLDPCCGSGGFLVAAARHMGAHGLGSSDMLFAGQALQERSWWLARMNLDLCGVPADLGSRPGMALQENLHAGKRFDVIMANPPFNMPLGEIAPTDPRWRYGIPPMKNANYAWIQHIVSSLSEGGRAAIVMPNGASSSAHPQERAIRKALVEEGVVEALITLPPQLFAATAVPVTVWKLRHPACKTADAILFIDARRMGSMISRKERILTRDDVDRIVATYENWRDRGKGGEYKDVPGFAASVTSQDIRRNDYRLNSGAYVATPSNVGVTVETMRRLRRELADLRERSADVDAMVDRQLDRIVSWTP